MLQYRSVDSLDKEDFAWEANISECSSQRLLLGSTGDEQDEFYTCKKDLERIRRENNRLVLEGAYLRSENKIYEKRLREESLFRERWVSFCFFHKLLKRICDFINVKLCNIARCFIM